MNQWKGSSCRGLAERDIKAGEEVCISYGQLSDAELLRIYGFVEARSEGTGAANPHNFVCIQTATLIHACNVSRRPS